MKLAEKLHVVHDSLTAAGLRHAFGGAIALGFCVAEPRGTRDLDVNIFIPAERAREATSALPQEVTVEEADIAQILRDGQARVWWDDTPIDLFLNNLPLHDEVAMEIRWVPFAGGDIPVLSCESLIMFKAFFNRTKDWADIEAIAETDPASLARAAARIEHLAGANDEFSARLRSLVG